MTKQENSQLPQLTIVIALVSDTTNRNYDLSHVTGCLQSLITQDDPPNTELIVPYPAEITDFESLVAQFPNVMFLPVADLKSYDVQGSSREHHDELRARGLAAARGEIVGLIEDCGRADRNWTKNILEAHRRPYAGVGGAIENEIDRPINWAVYFCDFGKYQNPVPDGETTFASDANVTYKRSVLEEIRSVWQASFHEPKVNWHLRARGQKMALCSEMIVYQHREDLTLGSALKERFIWGRSYAATRSRQSGITKRLLYLLLSPFLPAILLARMSANAFRKEHARGTFLKVIPLMVVLLLFWSIGEFAGYATAQPKSVVDS